MSSIHHPRPRRPTQVGSGVLVALGILLTASAASAQRGADHARQQAAPTGPTSGYPGLLDTELAEPGTVVVTLPSHTVFYGVSEHWTVGANLFPILASVIGTASGSPTIGLGLFARHRWYSTERLASTLDATTLLHWSSPEEGPASSAALMLTSNTTLYLGERHRLTGTMAGAFAGASSTLEVEGQEAEIESNGRMFAAGLGYGFVAADWLLLHANVLFPAYVAGSFGVASNEIQIEINPDQNPLDRTLYRAAASFRLGDYWLLDLGVVGAATSYPLPWLNLSFRF